MVGYEVTKGILDIRSAEAVVELRTAFEKVEIIANWLAHHPNSGTDPLTLDPFGYTDDEAYALRLFFETFNSVKVANASAFDAGSQISGLE